MHYSVLYPWLTSPLSVHDSSFITYMEACWIKWDYQILPSSVSEEPPKKLSYFESYTLPDAFPTLSEPVTAIKSQSSGKALGLDTWPAKTYKVGGPQVAKSCEWETLQRFQEIQGNH